MGDARYLDALRAVEAVTPEKARVFVMGLKRSGKSSVVKVVFNKMSPHETLFLEPNADVAMRDLTLNPLLQLQVLDFPGSFDFGEEADEIDIPKVWRRCKALVFVVDAQDEPHTDAIEYITSTTALAVEHNPAVRVEVLINKVDGDTALTGEDKKANQHMQRAIQEGVTDHFTVSKIHVPTRFFSTSIYDHSVFEATSKIVHALMPELPFLENLLDGLTSRCNMDKVFLFDVLSKVYLGTDSNPFDMQTYELCNDMIDVAMDVSCIYGIDGDAASVAFDDRSASVTRLGNGYVLYMREVSPYVALVCLLKHEAYTKAGLVEYNLQGFKDALADLIRARRS